MVNSLVIGEDPYGTFMPTSRAGYRILAIYKGLTAEDFQRMEQSAARIQATCFAAKALSEGKCPMCLRRSRHA